MAENSTQIILLPGMDGTGALFRPFVRTAPSWANPIIVSYPTDTIMDYAALSEYAEQFIDFDKPFILLGESFSGPVAIDIASRKPVKLTALILCASFIHNPRPALAHFYSETLSEWLLSFQTPSWIVKRLLLGETLDKELISAFKCALAGVDPKVLVPRLKIIMTVDKSRQLADCTTPLLYIRATKDKLVTERSLQEIMSVNPDVTTAVVDAPHLVLQTRPDECWNRIEWFLRTCSRSTAPPPFVVGRCSKSPFTPM